jgi:hypothetical protein
MRRLLVLVAAITAILVALVRPVSAGPSLNWGTEVNAGQCPDGTLVINVTHKVTNDADSGDAGNYWAYDNYNKHIQVWQTGADAFCAIVRYVGSFTTVATRSPGNTDDISAGITGTFQGGYRANITGTLDPSPTSQSRGNLGTFDYQWAGDPSDGTVTPFDWVGTYFSSISIFDQVWWGWIYHGGANGTWVNVVSGNSGDITD